MKAKRQQPQSIIMNAAARPILELPSKEPGQKVQFVTAIAGSKPDKHENRDQYFSLVNGQNRELSGFGGVRMRFTTSATTSIHDLIREKHQRQEPRHQIRAALWSMLLVGILLLGSLTLIQAKTHHSKRQTASSQATSTTDGPDQTNWWNLWWQQYIKEAEQPTVRPIASISFNGQTIKFPPPEFEQQNQAPTANMVVPDEDIERTARNVDKQWAARHQPPMVEAINQRPTNWASVKPAIIRVRQADSVRSNRQAGADEAAETANNMMLMQQLRENDDQATMNQIQLIASSQGSRERNQQLTASADQFGIQMRSNLNPAQSQRQQQQQQASNAFRLQQEQMQQQQVDDMMNSLFIEQQQQQHQMSDYDAEIDSANLGGGSGPSGDADANFTVDQMTGSGRQIIDSSSSNMMMPDSPKSTATSTTREQSGGRSSDGPSVTTTARTTTSTTARPQSLVTTERPEPTTTTMTLGSRQTIITAGQSSTSGQKGETGTTQTTRMPTRSGTTLASPSAGQTATTVTTTPAPQTERTMQSSTGTTSDGDININQETPISFGIPVGPASSTTPKGEVRGQTVSVSRGQDEAMRQTMGARQTTPNGRVELQNGKPSTSGMMLISRPELFGTTTTTTTTTSTTTSTTAASSSESSSTSPTSTSTAWGDKQPSTVSPATTSAPASASATTLGDGMKATKEGTTPTGDRRTGAPASTTSITMTTRAPVSGQESVPTTRTPAAMDATMEAATTKSSDSSDDETDDSTAKTDGASLATTVAAGNATATESESIEEESDEDDEEDTEVDQGAATNATTTPSSKETTMSVANQSSANIVADGQPATTQQPTLSSTMDIERLPKTGITEQSPQRRPGQSATVSVSSPTLSVFSGETSGGVSDLADEFARVKAPSGSSPMPSSPAKPAEETPVGPSGDSQVLMMTTDTSRGTLESETGITMPMDPMMRMLMMMMNQQQSTLQTNQGTTVAPTSTTIITSTESKQTGEFGTTTPQATSPNPSSRVMETAPTSSGVLTTSRKKLQPPPTTRTPTTTSANILGVSSVSPDSTIDVGRRMQGSRMQQQQKDTSEGATTTMAKAASRQDNSMSTMTASSMSVDEESGGREPKIELLNMDLVPIQRLMTQDMGNDQQQQQPSRQGSPMKQQQVEMGQPESSTMQTAAFPAAASTTSTTREPTVTEVEPGMRLRPIGSTQMQGLASSTKQPPRLAQQTTGPMQGTHSSRPQAPGIMTVPNQANTVYMIMMPQEQADVNQTFTTGSVQKTMMTTTTIQTPMTRQMLSVFPAINQQEQQQRAKTTPAQPGIMTSTTPAGARVSLPSRQPSDRLLDSSSSVSDVGQMNTLAMQVPMAIRKTATSGQQLMQTTNREMENQTTGRPRFVSQEQFNESTRQTTQARTTATPSAATPTTTTTTTTSARPRDSLTDAITTRGPSGLAEATTTTQTPTSVTTTKSTSTSRGEEQERMTTRPTPTAVATAGSRTTTTTATPSQFDTGIGGERRNGTAITGSELANLRQPSQGVATGGGEIRSGVQQKQQPSGKTSAGKSSHSSSFIPTKLRTDFNSQRVKAQQQQQQQQQMTNEIVNAGDGPVSQSVAKLPDMSDAVRQQAVAAGSQIVGSMQQQLQLANASMPAQSMSAIRQFGGSNRMSALKNAPVAFGRPATMMMTSAPSGGGTKSAKQLFVSGRQQPQPTVDYGPAIAVKRPDEPLANGQMPNCTLTGKNFCVITKDYPMNEVRQAVERSFRSVRLMYEELQTVSDQDLHRNEAEASGSENTTQLLTSGHGKFACQTKVEMLRPGWARDEISKEWLVVVNTDVFPQRVRTESCAQPMAPCEFVAPFYDSHCQQRYSLHRFIAVDPQQPSRVTTVLMRFKAGCNCFLKRKM